MRHLILLLILTAFVAGCKKTETPEQKKETYALQYDSSDVKATAVDAGAVKNNKLEFRFTKGSTYTYRLTKIQQDMQTLQAGKVDSGSASQTIIYIVELKADEVEKDYTSELSVTVKSIKIDGKIADKTIAYQSGQPVDSATAKNYFSYDALINNTFSVRIDSRGKVLDLFRVDRILNKLLTLSKAADSISANDKQLLQQDIIESGLKPMLAQIIPNLGEKEQTLNSEWSYKVPGPNMGLFAFENNQSFKFASYLKEGDTEFGLVEGKLTSTLLKSKDSEKMKIKFGDCAVNGTGKFYYNLTKGVLQKQKTKIVSTIDITAPVPTAQGVKTVKRYQKNTTINLTELL